MASMLLTSRSQLYKLVSRRVYTVGVGNASSWHPQAQIQTPATQHQSQLAQILPFVIPAISTLRPEKLVLSDFLVFAGESRPSFRTRLPVDSTLVRARLGESTFMGYQSYKIDKSDGPKPGAGLKVDSVTITASERFPRHAQGFLYNQQTLPRSACSIRFRCVPSLVERYFLYGSTVEPVKTLDPRSEPFILPRSPTDKNIHKAFKTGYDLALPDNTPWSIPVILVAGCSSFKYLRMQLLDDGLFSESELQEYEEIYNEKANSVRESTFLESMDDVFLVRFDNRRFWVSKSTAFGKVFSDPRAKYGWKLPYTGAAHARFELAPGGVPSRPAVHLRIVKIIEPVECIITDYDGFIHMPKEGELITHGLPGKSNPWICQLIPQKHSAIIQLVPVPGNATKANPR